MDTATLNTYPAPIAGFVLDMRHVPSEMGRTMANRVARQALGIGHAAVLTEVELATVFTEAGWTMADVIRRER